MPAVQMSKSEYMMFLKHPAFLWLKKHDKVKLPPIDDNTQARFDDGDLFESYAVNLFKSGVRIGFNNFDEYVTMPSRTNKAIEEGSKTLFQARFEASNITCICDVVEFVGDKKVDLTEIKSSSGVKEDHIYDLAFQTVVLQECGYEVRNISVIHVNGFYVRSGDINVNELCRRVDVTSEVQDELQVTRELMQDALDVIALAQMPSLDPPDEEEGNFYGWLELYQHLTPSVPGSIFDLCWPKQRIPQLMAMGVKTLKDIPDGFKLSPKQLAQVKANKLNQQYVDSAKVQDFLSAFEFPLYFLDYETLSSVIPAFDGHSPYQQFPFQYSLHVLDEPDGELRHFYYLHSENTCPGKPLTESLKKYIGKKGTILTWNASFEKGCNSLIGRIYPEYAQFYEEVNERIEDLAIPFQKSWYVNKDFMGSYSIKKVLPVLVPELSYKDLGINEGGSAQRLWMGSVLGDKYLDQKKQILADLEKYCELDTLAMVKIYEVLLQCIPDEQLSLI